MRTVKPIYQLKLVRDIVRAIHFLQEATIVHRDLKPSNILLSKKIEAKLIDFGSAYPSSISAISGKDLNPECKLPLT